LIEINVKFFRRDILAGVGLDAESQSLINLRLPLTDAMGKAVPAPPLVGIELNPGPDEDSDPDLPV
jgi:hypothetical protein